MSLISVFTDAVKKAASRRSEAAKEAVNSGSAGTLGSTTTSGGGAFTPLRPAPTPADDPGLGDQALSVAADEAGQPPDINVQDPVAGGSQLRAGIPEGHVPGGGSQLGAGIPEGHVPGGVSRLGVGIPEGHVPRSAGGSGAGIPEGHVPGGGDEDPDAGGEVAASLKTNIDPAFTRRLRFGTEEEPATLPLKDEGDYKVEGIDSVSDEDADLAERRAILSDFNFTKTSDKGSPSIASSDPEEGGEITTMPQAGIDSGAIDGSDDLVLTNAVTEEPERRLLTQVDGEGDDSSGDGERPGRGKPQSADEEGTHEEGQLVSLVDRRETIPIGGLKLAGDDKIEDVDLSVASSDPEEGGELTTVPLGNLDLASIQGAAEPEFADSSPELPQRRAPAQIVEEGGDPQDQDEGGPFGQGSQGNPGDEDSEGEGEQLVRLDRTGSEGSDLRDPNQLADAIDDRIAGRFPAGSIEGLKLEGSKIEPGDLKLDEYKIQLEYKPQGDIKVEDGIKFEGSKLEGDYKIEGADLSIASSDPQEGGEILGGLKFEGSRTEGLDLSIASGDPEEGGDAIGALGRAARGEHIMKVQMAQVVDIPPAAPPGTPVPYPNLEDPAVAEGDGAADVLARKAGGTQQDYFKIQMEDVVVSSATTPPEAPVPYPNDDQSLDDGGGAADFLARKAGGKQEDYLTVKMEEVFISRDAPTGEAPAPDANPDVAAFGSRHSEVKDSHDRHANTEVSRDAAADPAEDDFESSTLLTLEPAAAAKEMLPGLAGQVAETPDLDDIKPESDDDEHPDEIDL